MKRLQWRCYRNLWAASVGSETIMRFQHRDLERLDNGVILLKNKPWIEVGEEYEVETKYEYLYLKVCRAIWEGWSWSSMRLAVTFQTMSIPVRHEPLTEKITIAQANALERIEEGRGRNWISVNGVVRQNLILKNLAKDGEITDEGRNALAKYRKDNREVV